MLEHTHSPADPTAPVPSRPIGASGLMPLDDARQRAVSSVQPLARTERVPLAAADGRVLAEPLVSDLQVPPQDNSAMDGYAVRRRDLATATAATPVWLPIGQRVAAGDAAKPLAAGTAARVFTGATIPPGADAVVAQEATIAADAHAAAGPAAAIGQTFDTPLGGIGFVACPPLGEWIRRAGEDLVPGQTVLAAGTRLGPAQMGLAAALGRAELRVVARPRVALWSTGNELVDPGAAAPHALRPGQLFNTNRTVLRALLLRLGCEVSDLGNLPDDLDQTRQALATAAPEHDLLVTSGGVSVGAEDHVRPAVSSLGALDLWRVDMKPGKPFALGRVFHHHAHPGALGSTPLLGLPGNPVSSCVTFLLLVRPVVQRLLGMAPDAGTTALRMPAHFSWPQPDRRREFLRVRRNAQGGLDLFPHQGSGVLTSVSAADGLVDNPPGGVIQWGDSVQYLPFSELLSP